MIFISVWFRFLKTTSNGIRNFVDCKILISIADRSFKRKEDFFNPICRIILAICNYILTTKISFKLSFGYISRK